MSSRCCFVALTRSAKKRDQGLRRRRDGSIVSIYSDNVYQSYDLDFIQTGLARKTDAAMEELGFAKQGRHWIHPRTAFLVEFPRRHDGPLRVRGV